MTRLAVLGIYKKLLRTCRKTFKGDIVNQQIRSKFDENRGESDQLKIQKLIVLAEQTELIFKKNVVQGRPKSNDPETFELHLNEDSELGENDRRSSGPIAVPPKPKRK